MIFFSFFINVFHHKKMLHSRLRSGIWFENAFVQKNSFNMTSSVCSAWSSLPARSPSCERRWWWEWCTRPPPGTWRRTTGGRNWTEDLRAPQWWSPGTAAACSSAWAAPSTRSTCPWSVTAGGRRSWSSWGWKSRWRTWTWWGGGRGWTTRRWRRPVVSKKKKH